MFGMSVANHTVDFCAEMLMSYLNTNASQEVCTREVSDVMGDLKVTLGACSTSMHNALRDALSVEIGNLLHQMIVLQQHRPCSQNHHDQMHTLTPLTEFTQIISLI